MDQPGSSPKNKRPKLDAIPNYEVARALVSKGLTLGELGRSEDAIAVYDEVAARFGEAAAPELQEQVVRALVNKGLTLGELGRSEDAIAVYDEVAARFGEAAAPELQEGVARALLSKGLTLGGLGRNNEAEAAYRHGLELYPTNLMMRCNLAWIYLSTERPTKAAAIIRELTSLDAVRLALLQAGLEIAQDNFGLAVEHLGHALDIGLDPEASGFFADLLRLLRLGEAHGYGARLIGWLEESGVAERYAPVYGAFVAYVRGERFLLDLNPEVRGAARKLFDFLSAPAGRRKTELTSKPKRRGRSRK